MERVRLWYAWLGRSAPRLRDLVFIGCALINTLVQATAHDGFFSGRSLSTLIVGGAASLALWWRRRFPRAVTALAIVCQLTTMVALPMGIALFTLAIRRRDLSLAAATLAAYAAYIVSYGVVGTEDDVLVLVVTGPFVVGAWVAAGAYIGARRDLMASLRDRAERAEPSASCARSRRASASGPGSRRRCTTCWRTKCR